MHAAPSIFTNDSHFNVHRNALAKMHAEGEQRKRSCRRTKNLLCCSPVRAAARKKKNKNEKEIG